MKIKKIIIGAVLVFIGLHLLLLLVVGTWIYVLDETNGEIVSSGETRKYLLYVPPSYDRNKPTPLVVSMHGAALWPANQKNLSGWNTLADQQGFIVVYPSGTGIPRKWGKAADVKFFSDLLDTLQASYNIDPARIYVNGFSNGGGMALELGCKLTNRIAAVGTVAPALLLPWSMCADSRPVPMITFHGTADPLALFNGGTSLASPPKFITGKTILFESAPTWTANWARRNGYTPAPVESVAADVTRLDYTHCTNDAAVVFYTIQGGGHTWPGGKPGPEWWVGSTSNGVDATGLMWAFFREHRVASR